MTGLISMRAGRVFAAIVVAVLAVITVASGAAVAANPGSLPTVPCPLAVPGHPGGYSGDAVPPAQWTPHAGVDVPADAIAFASGSALSNYGAKYVQYTMSPRGYACDAHDDYGTGGTEIPERIAVYAPGDPVPVWNLGADKPTPYQVPLNVLCGWFPVLQAWQKNFGPQPDCEHPLPVPSWEHVQFFSKDCCDATGVVTIDAGHKVPFAMTSGHSDGATVLLLSISAAQAGGGVYGGGPECAATPGYAGSCRANLEQSLLAETDNPYSSVFLTDVPGILAAIRAATQVRQAGSENGSVTLTVNTLAGTAAGGRFTPSTRFLVATQGFCGDGLSPTIAVHSDVTGKDVTPPVLTYLPNAPSQFYIGQVGAASVQARCGGTVAARQPVVIQADAYVALGDSYGSGEGDSPASVYLPGTSGPSDKVGSTGCHRSPNGWANGVATLPLISGQPFSFVACSGGVISDLYDANDAYYHSIGEYEPPQIFSVDSSVTRLATLSIGGNNVGFSDIVSACVEDSRIFVTCEKKSGSTYRTALRKLGDLEQGGFPATVGGTAERKTLSDVYVDIASRLARNGILVVAGYPELFSTDAKRYGTTIAPTGPVRACDLGNGLLILKSSAMWINSMSVQGNAAIARQVDVANKRLAAVRPDVRVVMAPYDVSFAGHRVCDKDSWINGLRVNYKDFVHGGFYYQTSFHPGRQGQAAIANWVKGYAESAQWDQAHAPQQPLAPGSATTLSAAGFDPGEQVVATLHSTPVALGTYRADSRGVVNVAVRVPAAFTTGAHSIVLTGKTSLRSQTFPVTVSAVGSGRWESYRIPAVAAIIVVTLIGSCVIIGRMRRPRFG